MMEPKESLDLDRIPIGITVITGNMSQCTDAGACLSSHHWVRVPVYRREGPVVYILLDFIMTFQISTNSCRWSNLFTETAFFLNLNMHESSKFGIMQLRYGVKN